MSRRGSRSSIRAQLLAETVAIAERCTSRSMSCATSIRTSSCRQGDTPSESFAQARGRGRSAALAGRRRRRRSREHREGAGSDRRAALRAVLPDRAGYRRIRATRRDILCQGRGSAANSLVCYCLGVSAVDPERGAALLFERFISKERNEPPDIDIDFEHDRREEVIQYIYGKYGRERAAIAATVIMYRPRSALRDLGKVFGLDPRGKSAISPQVMQWWDGSETMPERVREAGFDPDDPVLARLVALARELVNFPGFPRHLSQHVGGFVISRGAARRSSCPSRTPPCPIARSCSGTRTTSTTWGC